MTQINPITVLIVEDHPVVRFGLVALIDSQPDMNVVAERRVRAEKQSRYIAACCRVSRWSIFVCRIFQEWM